MGDRALIIFIDLDDRKVSPTVYLHWSGSHVPELLDEHRALMKGRFGDLEYAAARFVGVCHSHLDGNLSLGMWNTKPEIEAAALCVMGGAGEVPAAVEALDEYSHDDAGVVIVNVDNMTWKAFGGYLRDSKAAREAGVEL